MNKNNIKFDGNNNSIFKKWSTFKISQLGKVVTGKTPSRDNPNDWGDIYNFITPTDIVLNNKKLTKVLRKISQEGFDRFKHVMIPANSVMVTCIGSDMGKVVMNTSLSLTNQQINSIIVNENFNNDYVYYALRYLYPTLRDYAGGGSTMPIINKTAFESLEIYAPEKPEQEQIAEILSSLDDKIELNQKINSNLEKIASLLFKQWFVDFEFPNENGKPFKSSGGRMIDSELGEIPKGWSIGFLGDNKLTQLVKPGIDEFKGEKIYLPTANVNESSIVDLNYKITYYNRPSRANMQPFPNSIWFAKMKNSKKVQLFLEREKWKLKNVILSTGFTGIRPLSNSTFYIWTIINSDFFEREKSNLAIGTTMQAINNENIRRIRYIIPQKNILDCFEKKVCMLYEAISINKEQIKSFSKIRDSLLPRLMSGKIKVG